MDKKEGNFQHEQENMEHSLVCNDQLFYLELKIAAEEAGKGSEENTNHDDRIK